MVVSSRFSPPPPPPTRVVASAPRPVVVSSPSPRVEPAAAPIPWKRVVGIKSGRTPLMVWISDEVGGALEHKTFDDEAVRLGSHAFRTVRISSAAARTDPYLAPYGRAAPAMLVFSPDLARVKATHGPALDARTALEAMRAAAKIDLGLDLDAAVTRARTLLVEEKDVIGRKATLARAVPTDADRLAALDRRLRTIRAEEEAVFRPSARSAR